MRMKHKSGKVTLVGAGPGAPDLLTLRAAEALAEADVVLHDRLIAKATLKTFAPKARLIYVGKKASYHTLPQDGIEDLLIAEARKGKNVVRLKGGDPYIFGRGGEEAERLHDEGVDFEVVPGVTSAFSAPLFAGIPLTHRAYTPEIAVITGHENPVKGGASPYREGVERAASSWVHWPTISKMGTIVFLMGMGNVRANMEKLIEHGLDPETPAAAVRWGSLAKQRSVFATVATLADRICDAGLKSPAVIVVGKVVGLAKKLNWFEKKVFYGKTFLVTRSPEDNAVLTRLIEKDAGRVIDWPSYEYTGVRPTAKTVRELKRVSSYDWLVFTSARAVRFFRAAYDAVHSDVRPLSRVKIAAVGARTARELKAEGLWTDLVAKVPSAAGLARERVFAKTKGLRIFLPQAFDARPDFAVASSPRHEIFAAPFYRKRPLRHSEQERAELSTKKVDWTLFFSPSAVDAFLKGAGARRALTLLRSSRIAAIGKTTAAHLRPLGLRAEVVSAKGTAEDVVNCIRKAAPR